MRLEEPGVFRKEDFRGEMRAAFRQLKGCFLWLLNVGQGPKSTGKYIGGGISWLQELSDNGCPSVEVFKQRLAGLWQGCSLRHFAGNPSKACPAVESMSAQNPLRAAGGWLVGYQSCLSWARECVLVEGTQCLLPLWIEGWGWAWGQPSGNWSQARFH